MSMQYLAVLCCASVCNDSAKEEEPEEGSRATCWCGAPVSIVIRVEREEAGGGRHSVLAIARVDAVLRSSLARSAALAMESSR